MPASVLRLVLAACLTIPWAAPAAALTVDQVIALRKAGVSNEIIQQMIDTEMAVQAQGGVGTYVVKQAGGAETIVYEARSPRGVVEYPVPKEAWTGGGVDRLGAALNIERRRPPMPAQEQAKAASPKARVQPVDLKAKGRWYRVLVGSFAQRDQAQAQGQSLKKQGKIVSFRVLPD
jgi:cell division septation protein DedD